LPAASRAVTVTTFAPLRSAILGTLQLVVPLAVPEPPRSLTHVTCVTPTLSDAVPEIETGDVDDVVGAVMLTTGSVVSAAAVTVHVKFCDGEVSTPSKTDAVTVYVPAVVGVPEMNPVADPMKSPGGIPVAA
jgi:hypothetical protein